MDRPYPIICFKRLIRYWPNPSLTSSVIDPFLNEPTRFIQWVSNLDLAKLTRSESPTRTHAKILGFEHDFLDLNSKKPINFWVKLDLNSNSNSPVRSEYYILIFLFFLFFSSNNNRYSLLNNLEMPCIIIASFHKIRLSYPFLF